MKIYWAGPLFTTAERLFNVKMKEYLEELGHTVWLPQEKEPRNKTAWSIFEMDVEGLDWAEMVVAVMDGPDPDSGTSWESGYAYKSRKPVINVRTDFRNSGDIEDARVNLMLHSSASVNIYLPFKSLAELSIMIDKAIQDVANKKR